MQERDTINILISQLLCKDDEIQSLRSQLAVLQKEQQTGNALVVQKLDKALTELQNMRKDNKNLADRLSKSLEAEFDAKQQVSLLSQALNFKKHSRPRTL